MYLYENSNIGDTALKEHILQNKSLHPYFESSYGQVRPKNCCGFISTEEQDYFIVPKIVDDAGERNLDIFLYMLMYAYDVNLNHESLAAYRTQKHRFLEVFIRMFADGMLDELKRGVFRQYITMQENLKVLRGRYMFERNFRNFHHQNLHCEFDEFSMDNTLNRFFLYALRQFKKFSSYPNLNRCEQILDEVEYFNIDLKRLDLRFDRMNRRYEKSFEIARMLLQKLIPLTGKAQNRSFAFLFDMAEVFEKFTGRLFCEIDPTARLQVQRNFGSLQLKPDIVTQDMIIDTKYKLVKSRDDLVTQDKYQMFAYGVNFGIRDVMLLYPKHQVDIYEDLELGKGENLIRLRMRSIDLNSDMGFEIFLNKIIQQIKGLK